MSLDKYVLLVMLFSGLVTWLSRITPFILLKKFTLPKIVVNFLSFVPISIMTALWVESLLVQHLGSLPSLNVENILASVPTVISAVISKNLMIIVIVGVVSLGVIKFVM